MSFWLQPHCCVASSFVPRDGFAFRLFDEIGHRLRKIRRFWSQNGFQQDLNTKAHLVCGRLQESGLHK